MRLLVFFLSALVPASAFATNLLTNGAFDADVSGWGSSEPVSLAWDALDVGADPGSGSLELTTMPAGMAPDFHGAVSECVAFTPGEQPHVEAWVYIPSEQTGPVQAAIGLRQFSSPSCQVLDLVQQEAGPITSALDEWVELSFTALIQAGVAAAQVYVQARESAGGMQDPTTTHWDAVFLPEPGSMSSLAACVAALGCLRRRRRWRQRSRALPGGVWGLVAGLVAVAGSAGPAKGAVVHTVVATSGGQAPGLAPGITFAEFDARVLLDEDGKVLFQADLAGPGITGPHHDAGIWRGRPGALALVAREGDVAPDVAPGVYGGDGFAEWWGSKDGAFAIAAPIQGGLVGGEVGLWVDQGAGLRLVARTGQDASSTTGSFDEFEHVALGGGIAALRVRLAGSGIDATNDEGLYESNASPAPQVRALEGSNAPGLQPTETLTEIGLLPVVGRGRTVAFAVELESGDSGLWTANGPSSATPRWLTGDFVPGSFFSFARFREVQVDAAGRLAFLGDWDGVGPMDGVFVERANGSVGAARSGDVAPGLAPATFDGFSALQGGASGAVKFHVWLAGAGIGSDEDRALYRDLGAGPELLFQEGDRAGTIIGGPGTIVIVEFSHFFTAGISDGGHVVTSARVLGPASDADDWLFRIDRNGTRERLLTEGQSLEVAPGDSRIVSIYQVPGVHDGSPPSSGHGINDRHAAAWVRFTDGSEAIVLVPESGASAAALAALATLLVLATRARRIAPGCR